MKCPFCGYHDSKVIDSRPTEENTTIRRRRECLDCKKRFTTYEKIERVPIVIVKKDGTRQSYDRNKILNGLIRACEKRPVALSTLEEAVNNIEKTVYNSMSKEISSMEIGNLVMDQLKKIDQVAYVRFASVYREFKDIDTFMKELESIKEEV
ncbi:MAG: transcriptional regulator NrdR [Bacillota bacterium]|nr:transcriptional regulator NrdR [Bacillota bacterium]